MTAVKSGLMIIDQHRADIRIRFEHYLEQLSQHTASTQRLLFPEVVQFAPSEAVLMQKVIPELEGIGFELTNLGNGSYAVAGVPSELDGLNPVALLRNMVSDAASGIGSLDQLRAAIALSLARNAAIPQGQVLSNEEMEKIINELFSCTNVNYTPDGKAIMCILPQHDIEQLLA